MIKFNCPKCGKEFKSKDDYAGRQFTCTNCDQDIRVPTLNGGQLRSSIATTASAAANVSSSPPLKKLAKASPQPPNELAEASAIPLEELPVRCRPESKSAPSEEPSEADSGVKNRLLIGLGIALLPLLPLFGGYDESIVAGWAFLCLSAAVIIWFFTYNKYNQDNSPVIAMPAPVAQEYRRTCAACGKVWHSLVSREAEIERTNRTTNWMRLGAGLSGQSSTLLQANRNLDANESTLAQIRQCPNCLSSNYRQEIIDLEPPT